MTDRARPGHSLPPLESPAPYRHVRVLTLTIESDDPLPVSRTLMLKELTEYARKNKPGHGRARWHVKSSDRSGMDVE